MNTEKMLLFVIMLGFNAVAQVDSSSMVFSEDQVYTYKFSFYTPDWADSLEYYKSLPDEPYMPGKMLFYNQKGDTIRLDSIGIRYKGNSSYQLAANSPKKPLKVRFDKYNKKMRFFGLEKLNFSNVAMDPSFMREKISYDIARAYMPAPRTTYANIYLEETLIGLYVQIEQVDKVFLGRYFEDDDGNLYKAADNGGALVYRGLDQSSYKAEYTLETNEKKNDWSAFINLIYMINNTPSSEFAATAGTCLDLHNCARHLAFTMVLSHFDSYTGSGRNFYFYHDRLSGKFSIIPWDLNLSFGGHTNNWDVISCNIVNISNLEERPLNKKILENNYLKSVYLQFVEEMIDGPASYDSVSAAAARIKPLIEAHVKADPNKFYSDSAFEANIENDLQFRNGPLVTRIPGLKSFTEARIAAIKDQLKQYSPVIPHPNKPESSNRISVIRSTENGVIVNYYLNKTSPVWINLYSMEGRQIKSLYLGKRQSGKQSTFISRNSFPPGLVTFTVKTDQGNRSIPALILR
jgi:hypothetical protein